MVSPPENNLSEQINDFRKTIARVDAALKKLEADQKTLNIKDFKTCLETFSHDSIHLINASKELREELEACLQSLVEEVKHPDYPTSLESALKEQKLPLSGTFPDYNIPPFKLSLSIDNFTVRLSMGKKSQQTSNLSPASLAQWSKSEHDRIVNGKFNRDQFCRELIEGYRHVSKSEWRLPVLIKDIYEILTIKSDTKQEYPVHRFMFDLSRLLEEYEIKYLDRDGVQYVIELSPHKQSTKNYTIVSTSGKERAIGNLIIWRL